MGDGLSGASGSSECQDLTLVRCDKDTDHRCHQAGHDADARTGSQTGIGNFVECRWSRTGLRSCCCVACRLCCFQPRELGRSCASLGLSFCICKMGVTTNPFSVEMGRGTPPPV